MEKYYIRTVVEPGEIYLRDTDKDLERLTKIHKGLRKLHTFEVMAVNIYRMQITSNKSEINEMVIQAMANEMTHVQDFLIKLYENGAKPSPVRWAFWLVGMVIGLTSRMLGPKMILKAGIWTEEKAVVDYQKIMASVEWDKETLAIINHNLNDERHHIETLRSKLEAL